MEPTTFQCVPMTLFTGLKHVAQRKGEKEMLDSQETGSEKLTEWQLLMNRTQEKMLFKTCSRFFNMRESSTFENGEDQNYNHYDIKR